MKKYLLLAIIIILLIPSLFANQSMNVRLGFLAPSGAKTGIFPGLSIGYNIDNIVDMGIGFEYFYSNDREVRTISVSETSGGSTIVTKSVGSDITTYYIPLMVGLRVGVQTDLPVIPYGGVGLGWGFLWEKVYIAADDAEEPPIEQLDETNFYNGFNWTLQLGAKYPLSTNVSLYGEGFYNGGLMKKNIQRDALGITWEEIKMSGFGLRAGLELRI